MAVSEVAYFFPTVNFQKSEQHITKINITPLEFRRNFETNANTFLEGNIELILFTCEQQISRKDFPDNGTKRNIT